MKKIMTKDEFIEKLVKCTKVRTLYVTGGFGAPLNEKNKIRYANSCEYNRSRMRQIYTATDDTFAFDCVCWLKGILWGFNFDTSKQYGGAVYCSNGVPDVGTEEILNYCEHVSEDMKNIKQGELLWMHGHVGVYYGNGKVLECTPKWKDGCQISSLSQRPWKKHGFLVWVDYNEKEEEKMEDKIFDSIYDCPDWSKDAIQWYIDNGYLSGVSEGKLGLTYAMLRVLVVCFRAYKEG